MVLISNFIIMYKLTKYLHNDLSNNNEGAKKHGKCNKDIQSNQILW